jgi:hypothetical protein
MQIARSAVRLRAAGLARRQQWSPDEALVPAHFTGTAAFPIYPELARAFGLGFGGSYQFKGAGLTSGSVLPLEEFVARERASFAAAGRERLEADPRWRSVATQLSPLNGLARELMPQLS